MSCILTRAGGGRVRTYGEQHWAKDRCGFAQEPWSGRRVFRADQGVLIQMFVSRVYNSGIMRSVEMLVANPFFGLGVALLLVVIGTKLSTQGEEIILIVAWGLFFCLF